MYDPGGGVLWLDSYAARQEYREGRGAVPAGQVLLLWDPRQGDVRHGPDLRLRHLRAVSPHRHGVCLVWP